MQESYLFPDGDPTADLFVKDIAYELGTATQAPVIE